MNWVDLVAVVFLIVCVVRGYQIGFVGSLFNLVVSVGSVLAAFFLYQPVRSLIEQNIGIPAYLAPVVAFIALLVIMNFVFHYLTNLVWKMISMFLRAMVPLFYLDKALGVIIQGTFGGLVALIVMLLVLKLPVEAAVKEDIAESYFAQRTLPYTSEVELTLRRVVGQLPTETFLYLIPRQPQSDESIEMVFPQSMILTVDSGSERIMLKLVNDERRAKGIRELVWDDSIVPVAREHSRDMFNQSYFSHVTPEGVTPAERMQKAQVQFLLSGENLAYAPTVEIAHQGLMQSPGHRENILRTEFVRIGIGVIDGGAYGKMFTQNFAD